MSSAKRLFVLPVTATLSGALAAITSLAPMSLCAETSVSPRDSSTPGISILVKDIDGKDVYLRPMDKEVDYEHAEKRVRGIREDTVRVFESGIQIYLRGLAVPELDMKLLRRRDIAALNPVLDSLSKYSFPIYDLDIRYVPKEDRAIHSSVLIELEQFIDEHSVGFLNLESIKEDGNDPRSNVTGLLINPHLPQLNRENWMPEKDAIKMITDVLMRDVKPDGTSDWFLDQVREDKFAGKLALEVGSSEEGITVNPIYSATDDYTIVRINLYDGSMETFANFPGY